MQDPKKPVVVILGAGYAGLLACSRILRAPGPVRVIVVSANPYFEQRIRLHETLAGQTTARLKLAPVLARRGVEFRHDRVLRLDPARQEVELAGGEVLAYDWLVHALGSQPACTIPGSREHAVQLDSRDRMQAMHARVSALADRKGRVIVLGGGLTAQEVSSELAERFPGLSVMMVSGREPGADLSPKARDALLTALDELGVRRQQGRITTIEPGQVRLAEGAALPFDLCIDCSGMRASPLAADSGLAVDEHGRVAVDDYLCLPGFKNVFVAGDAARVEIAGEPLRMACATAMPLGACAGMNVAALLAGRHPQAFDFGYFARFVSLGRRRGVTQFVDRADSPDGAVVSGFVAARYKEWICRMTFSIVKWELLTGLPLYFWPDSGGRYQEQVE